MYGNTKHFKVNERQEIINISFI